MDSQALGKLSRLFWLGRYVSRVITEIEIMEDVYDTTIDGPDFDYATFCRDLEIPNVYESSDDFVQRFMFDKDDPYSIISTMNHAYDNAIVLREVISSNSLSYIQMAVNTLESTASGLAPMLDLQSAVDALYAFQGCIEDTLFDDTSRNTLKCGSIIERIDIDVRLSYRLDTLTHEMTLLSYRMRQMPLQRDGKRLALLLDLAPNPDPVHNRTILIDCIEGLFPGV